jgi:predicted ATPase
LTWVRSQPAPLTFKLKRHFGAGAQLAREQGALFWELRVALSVAHLRVSQGRRDEAIASLAAVCDCFTEGFATMDMQAARTLLEGSPP